VELGDGVIMTTANTDTNTKDSASNV